MQRHAPISSALVGYVCGDDVAVRPVAAEFVFAHHSHAHFVSGLVSADHYTYGEGSVLHQTDLSPAGENPAAPGLFHRHVNPVATTEKNRGVGWIIGGGKRPVLLPKLDFAGM